MKAVPGKIIPREELASFRREHAKERIVFTNGCFDLIHLGHVTILERARAMGDCLVVGLNSDDSVRRLKGPERPHVGADDRAEILLALRSVDYVTVFGEDTPLETIKLLLPDVLVKGAEYTEEGMIGSDVVRSAGGRVERIEMVEERSTSALIARIKSGLPDKPDT